MGLASTRWKGWGILRPDRRRTTGWPVTTAQQREAFRRALRQARSTMGLSQRAVARAVGRTASAVSQWENGLGAPDPPTVAELERLLQLQPNSLARLLGYVPQPDRGDGSASVLDAVNADPRLDEHGRELLASVYRWLVHDRTAKR
jgi:transcriptional regulator with XRE-family HTH domain